MQLLTKLNSSKAPATVVLIRLFVGAVFLSEGIQKFLFPAEVGAGRFAKIGLPSPEFLRPFVGTFEIICGSLVLLGFFTRFAVIPLLSIMAVAIYTTKIPTLLKDRVEVFSAFSTNKEQMGIHARVVERYASGSETPGPLTGDTEREEMMRKSPSTPTEEQSHAHRKRIAT